MECLTDLKRRGNASDSINIHRLERESLRLLVGGFIFSILFHAVLFLFYPYHAAKHMTLTMEEPYRTIKTDIVEIPAGYSKPLIITPHKLIRKQLRRETRTANIAAKNGQVTYPELRMPEEQPTRTAMENDTQFLPGEPVLERPDTIPRRPWDRMPLSENLFNDNGTNTGEIIIPPGNPFAIQGYVHIPLAYGEKSMPADTLRAAVRFFASVISARTNIAASGSLTVRIGTPQLFRYPLIYLPVFRKNPLDEREIRNLGQYLLNGGFAIIDNGIPDYDTGFIEKTARSMMYAAIGSATGALHDIWIEPLPWDHPLRRCFYQLPRLSQAESSLADAAASQDGIRLLAFFIGQRKRLAGVYCNKGFCRAWCENAPEECLRAGVNVLVYALSRENLRYAVDTQRTGRSFWIPQPNPPERKW